MEITLQKIEQVRERSGLNYTEARELLEEAKGDVVQALVILENEEGDLGMDMEMDEMKGMVSHSVVDPVKRVFHKSNRTRIRVKNEDGTLLEIPATLGIAGALLAPRATAISTMALLMAQYSLEVDVPEYVALDEPEWT
ncbi:MAG TPA: DUF4342 domain-containing protein [Oscillospiraceae bacterium]|nr:DUF4342 domain-containing protein [Oscillospiraceae bacterium]